MPSSLRDLLPFSALRFLLENLYLIFMPVIIQGEKGNALGAQSENKPARFSAVTFFERWWRVLAGCLPPPSFTLALRVEVFLEKSQCPAPSESPLQGLESAAPAAGAREDSWQ